MKHLMGLVVALLLAFPASSFCEPPQEIRLITPEWEGQTNKDGTGLFFEIVKNVYEPKGIGVKFEFAPWKRAQEAVNHKEADAMLCVWKVHAEEQHQLTPAYPMFVEFTGAVFKKTAIPHYKDLTSLKARRTVWLRGYDYHLVPRVTPLSLQWSEVDTHEQAWQMVEAGRVDVLIDALIDIDNYVRTHAMDVSPYAIEILWGENAYVAFANRERSKPLMKLFDERILELFKSGELEALFDKWHTRFSPAAWERQKRLIPEAADRRKDWGAPLRFQERTLWTW